MNQQQRKDIERIAKLNGGKLNLYAGDTYNIKLGSNYSNKDYVLRDLQARNDIKINLVSKKAVYFTTK